MDQLWIPKHIVNATSWKVWLSPNQIYVNLALLHDSPLCLEIHSISDVVSDSTNLCSLPKFIFMYILANKNSILFPFFETLKVQPPPKDATMVEKKNTLSDTPSERQKDVVMVKKKTTPSESLPEITSKVDYYRSITKNAPNKKRKQESFKQHVMPVVYQMIQSAAEDGLDRVDISRVELGNLCCKPTDFESKNMDSFWEENAYWTVNFPGFDISRNDKFHICISWV